MALRPVPFVDLSRDRMWHDGWTPLTVDENGIGGAASGNTGHRASTKDGGRSDPARAVAPVVAAAVAAVVVLAVLLWPDQPDRETLNQASPFSTFFGGRYHGNTTFTQLA